MKKNTQELKKQAAERAVELIESGMVIGLGHGSTAILAIQRIAEEDAGAIVLIGHEENPSHLVQRLESYCAGTSSPSSSSSGVRTIGTGSQILRDLGIQKMRLLSLNSH